MKNLIFGLFLAFVLVSCGKDEATPSTPAVDYDAVKTTQVRIILNLPASVATTKAADKFYMAGSFKAPNDWKEKGTALFTEVKGGTHKGKLELMVNVADFGEATGMEFKIQRNGEWKYVEKSTNCEEVNNRPLKAADAGKTIEVKVDNFRNTGTCPD